MPAMSPTMTEGGIARWKKAEGESFEGGDVLLEIVNNLLFVSLERSLTGYCFRKLTKRRSTWRCKMMVSLAK